MNKTKIEWCDYTINPIKGLCKNNCWYCYAHKMYKRFGWNTKIRFKEDELKKIYEIKESSKIFIGSTHDIFGNWIPDNWVIKIINEIKLNPEHIFLFLTKFPKRYENFSFPLNCCLGITLDCEDYDKNYKIQYDFFTYKNNKENLRFISFEPLLGNPHYYLISMIIDWIIIGGLTPKSSHKEEWVLDLINRARKEYIPIFIKNNLHWHERIQEFPRGLIK